MSKFGQGILIGCFMTCLAVMIFGYMTTETESYVATLATPVVEPDVTDRMIDHWTFSVDMPPDEWKVLGGAAKLAALKVEFFYNDWRLNSEGRWEIVRSDSFEVDGTTFFSGAMSGTAANMRTQMNALALAAGVVSGSDTFE